MEKVQITHPDTKGTASVSRRSYERVWKPKGWRLGKSKRKNPNKENE